MGSTHKPKLPAPLSFAVVLAALYVLGTGVARAPDAGSAAPDAEVACLAPVEALEAAAEPLDAGQRALVEFVSRRFRIAREATAEIVGTAYTAAARTGLDPLLVLAVISIESRFNPLAESVMGAKGLMQIIPKFHRAKLAEHGGEEAVLDPGSNIHVGARILQEYIRRTGTLQAGLQYYNGASWDESAQYAQKVMAERVRLEAALRAGQRRAAVHPAAADPA
ncbi:MAG TPA: transglycosylase SLT domain-containing protein [Burkholderiales bacterium]|nr:transglycosylase SLT domain-containing protein [Burkholderiales bacterium]